MSYDLYVQEPAGDRATDLRLLAKRGDLSQYLKWVHGRWDKRGRQLQRGDYNRFIKSSLEQMEALNLGSQSPDLTGLPCGTWYLKFTLTLARPWISQDDDPFYVAEGVNPVRKDKVFKVPMMSASAWKGLLRWTMVHTRLALEKDALNTKAFAAERLAQALLFGDEKGEEPGQNKEFAARLDDLKPEARVAYEHLLGARFQVADDKPLPHHAGRLTFYPTFFNLIDVEVINPHSRETRAGTHPIYLECVPEGARGTFSLLYVPFDLVGQDSSAIREQAQADLRRVAEAVSAMVLVYGFSAKRSSGYGMAQEEIEGLVKTHSAEAPLTHLGKLPQEVKNVRF